jgi:hypothetical protein
MMGYFSAEESWLIILTFSLKTFVELALQGLNQTGREQGILKGEVSLYR